MITKTCRKPLPNGAACGRVVEAETQGLALSALLQHQRDEHGAKLGRPTDAARDAKASRAENGSAPPAPEQLGLEGLPPERPPADPNPELLEELAPVPAKRSFRERLWGAKRDTPADTNGAASKPAKIKRVRGKRISTAKTISAMYGGAGFLMVRTGVDEPVGRCLQFQAPAAGEILEDLTKDTFVDVPLQWVAERFDVAEKAGALLGLPLLVFLYERASAELRTMLDPMMREALESQIIAMVPVVKKQRKREAEMRAAMEELGLPAGADPITDLLTMMFTPSAPTPEAPADAAPAV